MADVTRLPGHGCNHHDSKRCLYQENLNPGYATSWRCRVLLHWEDAFDEFLARAESFGLSQHAVPGLWERKFERMARETFNCADYVFFNGADVPGCGHARDGLCHIALPDCEGRCRHYAVDTKE
ncbi:MAG: hypothetical protein OCC46_08585 [Pseudodesulfovibrio sp.]